MKIAHVVYDSHYIPTHINQQDCIVMYQRILRFIILIPVIYCKAIFLLN